jgi:flagellar basal-body rod modification protein FlgD
MGEMTQFSILEQITNLGQSQQAAASNEYDQQAVGLIGRTVTYANRDGSTATGLVQQVTFTSDGPTLTVDGVSGITPVTVTAVR